MTYICKKHSREWRRERRIAGGWTGLTLRTFLHKKPYGMFLFHLQRDPDLGWF
jgi:hypothetical protein